MRSISSAHQQGLFPEEESQATAQGKSLDLQLSQEQEQVFEGLWRIAVSGLVTYKFHSVNAERSLGFDRINHDENMKS